jgi:hypothetical protein
MGLLNKGLLNKGLLNKMVGAVMSLDHLISR